MYTIVNKMMNGVRIVAKMFVAVLALNACSSDTFLDTDLEMSGDDEQTLVINLSTGGDRLTTRAGRPLQSSAAGQDINHVSLYVLNTDGIVLQKQLDERAWSQALDYKNGKQLEVVFRASEGERLPEGDYTFYALGFTLNGDYQFQIDPLREVNAINGESFDPNMLIRIKAEEFEKRFAALLKEDKTDGEEIFAGKANITAKGDKLFKTAPNGGASSDGALMVLNRQLAGVMGYFTNIPAEINGIAPTHLRLIASNKNNQVNFINLLMGETEQQAKPSFVVNGSLSGHPTYPQVDYFENDKMQGYVVFKILLADFFPMMKAGKSFADCDLNKDGFVGYEDAAVLNAPSDFWVNSHSTKDYPQSLVKGSVFDSHFVIPFRWREMYPTFELQLLGTDEFGGDIYLKSWNIKISEDQLNPEKPLGSTSTGVIVVMKGDKSTTCFNVYRNHFYALGKKTSDGDGQMLNKPTESDQPLDLSRSMELVVSIYKQWSGSEQMQIR